MLLPKEALRFNALTVIIISLISYFYSSSITALIPMFFGLMLFLLYYLYDKNNKLIAHIAVLLILLLLVGFQKPLSGAIDRSDLFAILRVTLMILATTYTLVCLIKSFIEARKK